MEESEQSSSKGSSFDRFGEGSKHAWQKGKDRLRDLGENVSRSLEDQSNEKFYSALAYVPVIGPIVTWLFKRAQKLTRLHTIQAFYLQLSFLVVWLVIWLLENLPLISDILSLVRFKPNMTDALMYLNVVSFIIVSALAAFRANQGERWQVPGFFEFMNKYFRLYESDAPQIESQDN